MEDPITPSIITNSFTTSNSIQTGHISTSHLTWSGGNLEGNVVSSIVYVQHPLTQQFQESTLTIDSPFVEGTRFEILNGNQTWTLKANINAFGDTLVARDAFGEIYGSEVHANVFRGNLLSMSGSVDQLTTKEIHGNLTGKNVHVSSNVSAPLILGNVGLMDSYVETPTLFGNVVGNTVEVSMIEGKLTGDVNGNLIGEIASVKTMIAEEVITTEMLTSNTGIIDEIQCQSITFDEAIGNIYGNVHGPLFGEVIGNVTGNLYGDVSGNLMGNVTGNLLGHVRGDLIGNVEGNVQGYVTGNLHGDVQGDVKGNLEGDVIGNVTGILLGQVVGNLLGSVEGNVVGKLNGPVQGNVLGDLVGNVLGNVQGDLHGNVVGNVQGDISGNVYTTNRNLHLGTNTFHEIYLETNGTKRVHITEVGGIGIGTDYVPDILYALDVNGRIRATKEITAFSDRRLKCSIQPLVGSREKLRALKGVSFERVDDPSGNRSIGLIAQEVEKIVPEAVCTDSSKEGFKSIAYGNLVGLIIEAVKEIEAHYENKIQDLMSSIEQLKQTVSDGPDFF